MLEAEKRLVCGDEWREGMPRTNHPHTRRSRADDGGQFLLAPRSAKGSGAAGLRARPIPPGLVLCSLSRFHGFILMETAAEAAVGLHPAGDPAPLQDKVLGEMLGEFAGFGGAEKHRITNAQPTLRALRHDEGCLHFAATFLRIDPHARR